MAVVIPTAPREYDGVLVQRMFDDVMKAMESAYERYKTHIWLPTTRSTALLTATTYVLFPFNNALTPGTNLAFHGAFPWDPADYAVPGRKTKIRLSAHGLGNTVAPACTFTVGLYAITATGAAAGTMSITLGSVLTSVVLNPGTTQDRQVTADIDAPAAGQYVVGFTLSANQAANSLVAIGAALQYRQV